PLMRQDARKIDWHLDSASEITRKINAADSFPGVLDTLAGQSVYLFGARAEERLPQAEPGDIIGYKDGAICRAARDGWVWIRQLKLAHQGEKVFFKLPALQVLTLQFPNSDQFSRLKFVDSRVQRDIGLEVKNSVAYVTFD